MHNQEIITILDALQTKKSWLRTQYNNFCTDWAALTADVEPAEKVYLFDEDEYSFFLLTGDDRLDYDYESGYGGTCSSREYPQETISRIRKVARASGKIANWVKDKQLEIDRLNTDGEIFRNLITR